MRGTTIGALATFLVSLAQCDPLIFDWDDVPVSNEIGCGSVTINSLDGAYKGVYFQDGVTIYNTTSTPACSVLTVGAVGPRHASLATTGTNIAQGPDILQILSAPTTEFVNGLTFNLTFDKNPGPDNSDDTAFFQLDIQLSDFGINDQSYTFKYNFKTDGLGPHTVSITNMTSPYILSIINSGVWSSTNFTKARFFNAPFYTDHLVYETATIS